MENNIIKQIKTKKNKIVITTILHGKKIKKRVTDLAGNPLTFKNYLTRESIIYAGKTSVEIDAICQ